MAGSRTGAVDNCLQFSPAPVTVRLREGVHQLAEVSEAGINITLPTVTLPSDSVAILNHAG